jgi:hypothetical protein
MRRYGNARVCPDRGQPKYLGAITRTLTARNEYHTGNATFERKEGVWICLEAEEPLRFLIRLSPVGARFELISRGYVWEWTEAPPA